MDRPGHYRAVVEAPLWPEGPDPVKILMDKMALVLEKYMPRNTAISGIVSNRCGMSEFVTAGFDVYGV
jgi:hypothetical protein